MDYLPKIKEKILCAPNVCGVYLMRDRLGRVLYVGKAKALKQRLRYYLKPDLTGRTQILMAKVADLELRLTGNEQLALLLEFKLIHEFNPKYNVSLKDGKSFAFVRISQEKFPAITVARKKQDAAIYLGPYTNTKLLKKVLKIIRLEFAYRSCPRLPKQSCLYQKINLCPAPCVGSISQPEYRKRLANIILILEGRADGLVRKLTKSMQNKSNAGDFEAAARMRDQIIILSKMSERSGSGNCKNALEELKSALNLKKIPLRIEGFDISNISGKLATGAMVSFYNGQADKNNYRRFRIKTVQKIDDYKMLAELLARRYSRLLKEKKTLPDLLLIDGGKGHLLTAIKQLAALNLHIPVVSIAKEKENIYSSQPDKLTLSLAGQGEALNLMRRIRDEAHRFAVSYHRLLRQKELLK